MSAYYDASIRSRRLATFITDKLAPAYVGAALILLVAVQSTTSLAWGLLGGTVGAACTCLIPEAFIRAGARRKRWDRHVQVRQQRVVPLSMAIVSGLVGIALLARLGAAEVLLTVVGSGVAGVVVSLLVNLFWKASIHAGAMWGATTYAYLLAGPVAGLLMTSLCVLAMWSRVRLRHHTMAQVLVGAVLGVATALIGYELLPPLIGAVLPA